MLKGKAGVVGVKVSYVWKVLKGIPILDAKFEVAIIWLERLIAF